MMARSWIAYSRSKVSRWRMILVASVPIASRTASRPAANTSGRAGTEPPHRRCAAPIGGGPDQLGPRDGGLGGLSAVASGGQLLGDASNHGIDLAHVRGLARGRRLARVCSLGPRVADTSHFRGLEGRVGLARSGLGAVHPGLNDGE